MYVYFVCLILGQRKPVFKIQTIFETSPALFFFDETEIYEI